MSVYDVLTRVHAQIITAERRLFVLHGILTVTPPPAFTPDIPTNTPWQFHPYIPRRITDIHRTLYLKTFPDDFPTFLSQFALLNVTVSWLLIICYLEFLSFIDERSTFKILHHLVLRYSNPTVRSGDRIKR